MSDENGGNVTSVGSSAYSFYLNIVVLDQIMGNSSNVPASPSPEVVASASHLDDQVIPEDEHESSEVTIEEESRMTNTPEKKKSWMKSLASPTTATSVSENSLLNKSLHSMRALNQRGAQFVANKTMVSRAVSSLNKSLTDLQQIGQELELTIAKRFNQGKVIVLHVILKPASMSRYMEEIRGAVAAEHYQKSMSTLKLLGATETMASLEREMLLDVKQGLMDKVGNLVAKTMKEKEGGLEIECIALEEAEEARWLFTYMEFQAQMK